MIGDTFEGYWKNEMKIRNKEKFEMKFSKGYSLRELMGYCNSYSVRDREEERKVDKFKDRIVRENNRDTLYLNLER